MWFPATFDSELLERGEGLLPFAPASLVKYHIARRFREEDQRVVMEGLVDISKVSFGICPLLTRQTRGVEETEVRRQIRLLPFKWYRYCQRRPDWPGLTIMEELSMYIPEPHSSCAYDGGVAYVTEKTGRTYGHVGRIWDEIHRFLDPEFRCGTPNLTKGEIDMLLQ